MVTYPDDATVSLTAFGTIGETTYTDTGSTEQFALPTTVGFVGEVIALIDGTVQDISSYYLSNSGGSVTFVLAPAASNLTLKTISLPERFRVTRNYPAAYYVHYSNTSATVVDSNTYLLNGVQTSFSLPTPALGQITDTASLLVSLSGAVQESDSYTWPSATLGQNGIDLSDAPGENNTLEIRAFIPSVEAIERFTSMADRKPDNGFGLEKTFNTKKYESQVGYEKRRLMSRRPRRVYTLVYTNVSGVEKQAIENFYDSMNGEYDTFTFDLAHINSTGTVRTRFEGPLDVKQVISVGSELTKNFYTVSFRLREDYA